MKRYKDEPRPTPLTGLPVRADRQGIGFDGSHSAHIPFDRVETFAKWRTCLPGLFLSLLFTTTAFAQSDISRVWAVDDGEKVKRDDLSHWAATSNNNPVWDGNQ